MNIGSIVTSTVAEILWRTNKTQSAIRLQRAIVAITKPPMYVLRRIPPTIQEGGEVGA
jgi:uncharacterized protein YggT (Ycf19 family)